MSGAKRLEQIAARMRSEIKRGAMATPEQVKAREFVGWFGYQKRVKRVVSQIRNKMEELDLRTVPDFEFAWIDKTISIEFTLEAGETAETSEELDDPTIRIGTLEAANREPTKVKPDDPLKVATTLMHINDFSQLPVMTTRREVKGIISWKSIGTRRAQKHECNLVGDCMDSAPRGGDQRSSSRRHRIHIGAWVRFGERKRQNAYRYRDGQRCWRSVHAAYRAIFGHWRD